MVALVLCCYVRAVASREIELELREQGGHKREREYRGEYF
jgi:hypothetical protein